MTPNVLAWDSSALHHALIADRADVLGDLACGPVPGSRRNVSTRAVFEELAGNGLDTSPLSWLELTPLDGLMELSAFTEWQDRVAAGPHHMGEATVFAWAEVHAATAIVDDRDARRVGQYHGLEVHGTLWLIACGVRDGQMPAASASCFVDALIDAGARYPFPRGEYIEWAKRTRLLS